MFYFATISRQGGEVRGAKFECNFRGTRARRKTRKRKTDVCVSPKAKAFPVVNKGFSEEVQFSLELQLPFIVFFFSVNAWAKQVKLRQNVESFQQGDASVSS